MKQLRIPLRAVFYKENEFWIAHCLEFDLVGHGLTRKKAMDMLADAITLQVKASIKHKNPNNLFSPAEKKFHLMFAAGRPRAVAALEFEPMEYITIESMDTREYSAKDADLVLA